jgi:hypothetical protein
MRDPPATAVGGRSVRDAAAAVAAGDGARGHGAADPAVLAEVRAERCVTQQADGPRLPTFDDAAVNPALPIDEETDGQQITIADVADGEPWNYSMVFRERE